MSELIEYINPNVLKPDPNQPRKHFDEEEIEQLAKSYDTQKVINPIEVDENNFIILGERRWRAAKKKRLQKIPVRRKSGLSHRGKLERQLTDDAQRKNLNSQEKVWAYTTAIANINTEGDYTIEDIKEMYKSDYKLLTNLLATRTVWKQTERQKGGQAELSDRIGVPQPTITGYMSFFRVGKKLQKVFLDGKIEYTFLRDVARLKDPKEQERIEKILVEDSTKPREERRFTQNRLLEEVLKFNKGIKEEAKKEVEKPEVSRDAVMNEAIKLALKKQKKIDAATKALNGLKSKIKEAEEIGLDVTQYKSKTDQMSASIKEDPDGTKKEINNIKKELTDIVTLEKCRQKVEKFLSEGNTNVMSILEEAKQLGLNVSDFEERISNIRQKSLEDSKTAYEEVKVLKEELKKAVTTEKERQENVTNGQKIIDQIKNKLWTAKKYEKYSVNIPDYELRINELSDTLQEKPKETLEELENLEKELNEEIKIAKIRIKEEKLAREKLKKDEEYRKELARIQALEDLEVWESLSPKIQKLILDAKSKVIPTVVKKIAELKDTEKQKEAIDYIRMNKLNEELALNLVERMLAGPLLLKVPLAVSESDEALKEIEKVYHTVKGWGISQHQILGPRWEDALQYLRKIKEHIIQLEALGGKIEGVYR